MRLIKGTGTGCQYGLSVLRTKREKKKKKNTERNRENWKNIKTELWMRGWEEVEEFLGYSIDFTDDKDVVDGLLDQEYKDMSDKKFAETVEKYLS